MTLLLAPFKLWRLSRACRRGIRDAHIAAVTFWLHKVTKRQEPILQKDVEACAAARCIGKMHAKEILTRERDELRAEAVERLTCALAHAYLEDYR